VSARILVVANRTAESPELLEALRRRAADSDCVFTLLVPSTPEGLAWAADMHAGDSNVQEHRQAFVDELREEGLEVSDAKVGDGDPLAAIQDECNFSDYDEIIVSTLPLHISKWLHIDLPHKAGHATGLPVTHVVGSEGRR
jgi:nucleotide-binding universal stress UspA family protein